MFISWLIHGEDCSELYWQMGRESEKASIQKYRESKQKQRKRDKEKQRPRMETEVEAGELRQGKTEAQDGGMGRSRGLSYF